MSVHFNTCTISLVQCGPEITFPAVEIAAGTMVVQNMDMLSLPLVQCQIKNSHRLRWRSLDGVELYTGLWVFPVALNNVNFLAIICCIHMRQPFLLLVVFVCLGFVCVCVWLLLFWGVGCFCCCFI